MSTLIPAIERRKSIRAFDATRPIAPEQLAHLFEAARLAPSSFNEQPWRFLYATAEQVETREQLLACINELNRQWAKYAPLLLVSIAKMQFTATGKPNPHAWHDTGAAVAHMALQAAEMGMQAHQMAGFFPDMVRQLFKLPEGFEPVAAIAIGYPGNLAQLPVPLQEREQAPQARKSVESIFFTEHLPD